MWTWSHVMVSTIVFGPSPEMFWGTVLPDTFDYVNWIKNFGKKKVSVKLLLKDQHKFNKKNNEGLVWDIDQAFHSFICTGVVIGLAVYFLTNNSPGLLVFFGSWALHTLTDYLTHTDQIYPFFPFSKWGVKLGLLNYNPASPLSFVFDAVLLAGFLMRMGWLHF